MLTEIVKALSSLILLLFQYYNSLVLNTIIMDLPSQSVINKNLSYVLKLKPMFDVMQYCNHIKS